MNYEDAIRVRDQIAAFLNLDATKRRAPLAPRVAIGLAPGDFSPFKIALRAPSEKELERALGEGVAKEVKEMAGYELDIRVTGPVAVEPPTRARPTWPLTIGASVGHYNGTAGSLGFFAQSLSDDKAVGFVSNNHVIADCDYGKSGDRILHPGPLDSGDRSKNVIADLAGGYPQLQKNGAIVDAAFARLHDVPYDALNIGSSLKLQSRLVPLYKQRDVLKFGRSTGLTHGKITAIALLNLDVHYPMLKTRIRFDRQIEIAPDGDACFSEPGDSGSLVVNPEGHPIGLLFAANHDGSYAYANPIADVLRELDIRMLP